MSVKESVTQKEVNLLLHFESKKTIIEQRLCRADIMEG
jgi:hypothetical protein